MLDQDRLGLSAPLPNRARPDVEFSEAIGVLPPRSWTDLVGEIAQDAATGSGVRWWSTLDIERRRLIYFQLAAALATPLPLVVRARLHEYELREQRVANSANPHAAVLQRGSEPLRLVMSPRVSAADHLPPELISLHVGGAVHALFSALDVLGAVIVGTCGLPTPIVEASLRRVLGFMRTPPQGTFQTQREAWAHLEQAIRAAIDAAGPPGWWAWLSNSRHTIAHRPRLPIVEMVQQSGSVLVVDPTTFLHGIQLEPRLPRSPHESFVRSLAAETVATHLTESAETTLEGLRRSVLAVLESVGSILLGHWRSRRDGAEYSWAQPASQWEELLPVVGADFPGYRPQMLPTGRTQLALSVEDFARLRNASDSE
ncbi:MAG: hypothetical protein QM817_40585 [Archangium sp.]